jgi:tetratricopeptide (TPR) repeat protein/predicted Ser/Thr protein kinase
MGSSMIGPYELREQLGAGGMGVVYRARREGAESDVALKVIAAGEDASAEALARFQREARIATELDHPGIVKVLETGEADGQVWFAMELVEGEPLSKQIKEREFTWQEAVTIVRDVADALSVAHEKGVLHRDIKPSNIIMDVNGKPHLTDFGLAKDTRTESKFTRTGQDLADLSPASDVWALGCVLHELIMNEPAFVGDTPAAIVGAVITGARARTASQIALPRPVQQLIDGCLQGDAARRPADAGRLGEDADRVLAGQAPVHAKPAAKVSPAKFVVVALIVLVAGIGGMVALGGLYPRAQPKPPEIGARTEAAADLAWSQRSVDPAAAIATLEALLDSGELDPRWLVRLGLLQWSTGDHLAARRTWRAVPQPDASYARAHLYLALQSLWDADALPVSERDAMDSLAVACAAEGDPGRLGRAMRHVIGEPDFAAARTELKGVEGWEAEALRGFIEGRDPAGDRDAALRHLDNAQRDGMRFPWMHVSRGTIYVTTDLNVALAEYDKALEMAPRHAIALSNRALVLSELGRQAEALESATLSLEGDPANPRTHYAKGLAQFRLDRFSAARASYDTAAARLRARRPAPLFQAQILWRRSEARSKLEDHAGALADVAEAVRLNPGDPAAGLHHLRMLSAEGMSTEAAAEARRLAALDDVSDEQLVQVGTLMFHTGNVAEALPAFDRVLKRLPFEQTARAGRALCLESLGRYDEAMDDLKLVIEAGGPLAKDAKAQLEVIRARTAAGATPLAIATERIKANPKDVAAREERMRIYSAEYTRLNQSKQNRARQLEIMRLMEVDVVAILEVQPKTPKLWTTLIVIRFMTGRFQETLDTAAEMDRVVPNAPERRGVQRFVDQAKQRLGR